MPTAYADQALTGLNHIDALLADGWSWNFLAPTRYTIYYTFNLFPDNPSTSGILQSGVTPFNTSQQAAVQMALDNVSELTGIVFTLTNDGEVADLRFGAADISNSYWGYTTFSGLDGWIYLDNVEASASTAAPTPGAYGYELLLHELGHVLGLKHPFEGSVRLPESRDTTDYSLMSYTKAFGPPGGGRTYHSQFSPYDIAALLWLYGDDGLGGEFGLSAPGVYLVGSEDADVLNGGSSQDVFEGKGGNDTINGGGGSDTVRFSGDRALYTIVPFSGGITISGPDGIDTLTSVETAVFVDATIILGRSNSEPTGSITITGSERQGSALTGISTLADADGLGNLTWRWQSSPDANNWNDIDGVTSTNFTPGEAQVGLKLRVLASYTDGLGTAESVVSASSAVIANVNDSPSGTVTIVGVPQQGVQLAVNKTLADADGLGTLALRWQSSANGSSWTNIALATANTFTPGEAQVGLKLRVTVSYVDDHGTAELVAGTPSATVLNTNDAPTGKVALAGFAEQGQSLQASNTLADADGLGTLSYEWQSSTNGQSWTAITGAGGASFTPGLAQVGQLVRAVARYTDGHGSTERVTSSATTTILGHQIGAGGVDSLRGTAVTDRLDGLGGNDLLTGFGGNDQLNGGNGIDTAVFQRARSNYIVSPSGTSINALAGDEGTDTLSQIERLQFSDQSLAFDIVGAAGTTARILGAVFGRAAVANKEYVGIGLSLLDGGMDNNSLMQLALNARLGADFSAADEVSLLYQNLLGMPPPAAELEFWTSTLQSGQYTTVSLAWMAANLELNAQNIDLVGLAANGLGYTG
jgi:hypothetical protein